MKLLRWSLVCLILYMSTESVFAETHLPEFPIIRVTYHLQDWLGEVDHVGKLRVGGVTIHATPLVYLFYKNRGFRPAWSNDKGPILADIDKLLDVLSQAQNDGLDPEDYHIRKIEKILLNIPQTSGETSLQPIRIAALDLLLTDAFFLFASHLSKGRVDPRSVDEQLPEVVRDFELPDMLEEVLVTGKIRECFAALAPHQPEYLQLRLMLQHYRQMEGMLDAVIITSPSVLQKGDRDATCIPALRLKLYLLGDLTEAVTIDDTFFSQEVETALKRFQQRYGLEESGVLDDVTRTCLNRPGKVYIQQLEVNLERLRWHPVYWEKEYIRVNIPDFSLSVMRDEKERLTMRVVTGKTYSKTPIFSDQLRFIVINPYWEIPPNIILRDKISAIRYEPDFFEKRHIKVIKGWGENEQEINPESVDWQKVRIKDFFETYRLRQAAGPENPLGRIKFMFPNAYSVYLHDTPQRELFNHAIRSFSSGCIRLEHPYELAVYCLRHDQFWNKERLQSALEGKLEQRIKLTNPIPIHILYWTAWVDQTGQLHFRDDVYGRDQQILAAFDEVYFPDYTQPITEEVME